MSYLLWVSITRSRHPWVTQIRWDAEDMIDIWRSSVREFLHGTSGEEAARVRSPIFVDRSLPCLGCGDVTSAVPGLRGRTSDGVI
jgi:hypothetical protein